MHAYCCPLHASEPSSALLAEASNGPEAGDQSQRQPKRGAVVGWLRDLMREAEPPLDGYGELARRALAHAEWPADTQPQWRSLAALFSKLDRNIELEWLADREAVQRTLSLVLGCALSDVQRVLASVSEPNPAG